MNTPRTDRVTFYPTTGKLPSWVHEALHAATRRASPGTPSALVVEGQRKLIVIDSDDWNTLIDSIEARGDERGAA